MALYVPPTDEADHKKQNQSLQLIGGVTSTNTTNIATNTTNIATNTASITALQVLPYKIVSFSRVLSVASGSQAVTGVGFQPRLILFQTGVSGGGPWSSSGQCDAVSNFCIEYQMASTAYYQGFAGIQREDLAGTKYGSFVLASFDADGFTLTWTKVSTPTITASITATCFR